MKKERSHPYNPARTLARAHLTGLSALKDLVRERVIKSIKPVYERTLHLWTKAQEGWEKSKRDGERDFSHITEVERHLRRNQLTLIWETTARYGNREYKRVRNEREGRVGPMNRLLNMAGAQLRNYAMTRFPFPEPEQRGKERGYWGDDTFPWVDVIHRTLPELDFIDMIRAHVFELCRKCFIHAVPVRDARNYVNLLIWRLSPFLEHLYTSEKSGRWGFKRTRRKKITEQEKCADEILRDIVEELRALTPLAILDASVLQYYDYTGESAQQYYYTVVAVDLAGNYAQPVCASNTIQMIEIKVKTVPGSVPILFETLVIEITDGETDVTLSYNSFLRGPEGADATQFSVDVLRDPDGVFDATTSLASGALVKIFIDAGEIGLNLHAQSSFTMKIIPTVGQPTLEICTIPYIGSYRYVTFT